MANDDLIGTELPVGWLMALNMPAANLAMQVISISMVWFAAHRIGTGEMEVGSLVAFIAYIAPVLISVLIASMMFAMAPRAIVSGRRIREVLELAPAIAAPATPQPLPEGARVEFRDVGFAYGTASDASLRRLVGIAGLSSLTQAAVAV